MEIYNQIEAQKQVVNAESKKLDELLKTAIDAICPYKVGDIVPVHGYSHSGKKCRVKSIYLSADYEISIRGTVIKKDGSDSDFTASWHTYNDPALKEATSKLKHQPQTPLPSPIFRRRGGTNKYFKL